MVIHLYLIAAGLFCSIVLVSHALGVREPFQNDAVAQHDHAVALAQIWARDGFPSSADFVAVTGTRSWGPELLLTIVYRQVGSNWLWGKLALALGSALGPVSVYVLARKISTNSRVWSAAFLVVALWPAAAFWSAIGVKDGFVGGLSLATLAVALHCPGFRGSLLVVIASSALLLFRPVVAVAMLIALAAGGVLSKRESDSENRSRQLLGVAGALLIAFMIVFPRVNLLIGAAPTLTAEIRGAEVSIVEGGLRTKALLLLRPDVIVHGLLSPIPWLWDAESASPFRWLYPSFAIWMIVLPLSILGAVRVARRRSRSAVLVLAFAAAYLGSYYLFFSGDFTRQRTLIEPLGLLLASVVFAETPRLAIWLGALWVVPLGTFALGHVLVVGT